MFIEIKVKTNSSQNKLENLGGNTFKVFTKESPEKGKANKSVISILSEHFGVSQSNIKIIRGDRTSNKLVKII